MHTNERNRIAGEKVRKVVFCRWNVGPMHELHCFNKKVFWNSLIKAGEVLKNLQIADGAIYVDKLN